MVEPYPVTLSVNCFNTSDKQLPFFHADTNIDFTIKYTTFTSYFRECRSHRLEERTQLGHLCYRYVGPTLFISAHKIHDAHFDASDYLNESINVVLVWPTCRTPAVGGIIVCECVSE